jgi:hypothetical protein
MFLDCLELGVPVVSLGWHDFSYKRGIAERGMFRFAGSLAELEQLCRSALRGRLPAAQADSRPFLEPTAPARAREFFRGVFPAAAAP